MNPIRLLLVDDHKILREGLKEAIDRETDMEVAGEADNGRQALILVEELKPDLVIMDISMPDLNGIEAARQMIHQNPDQKIIALSMYSDRHYVMGMLDSGVLGYILKTNAFEELARAVRKVVSGQSYISSEITEALVKSALENGLDLQAEDITLLSPREVEVLRLIALGKDTRYMASQMGISQKTVEIHRKNLRKKLDLNSIAELTRYAVKKGIISL